MFVKHVISILLTAGVVILAASSILPAAALAPEVNAPSGGESPDDALATTSVLGGEIQISLPTTPECDRYQPSVAYNWVHDEYLVVWHNAWPDGHQDIYARRVSHSGQLLSWFSVSAGANDRVQPAVAYNASTDEYLVVWMYNANGDGSTYEIWGRTIAWNGAYQNLPFQIITWPNRTFWTPRVAWNSIRNEYLVVWSAHDATTLTPPTPFLPRTAANYSAPSSALPKSRTRPTSPTTSLPTNIWWSGGACGPRPMAISAPRA